MGDVMREATFSLAQANFAAGDFRYISHTMNIQCSAQDIEGGGWILHCI